ncbi:MAG: tRNA (N6-threonylcarbamoyladenosine(37)-N6)-methyltransferase TrmO, partial [Coriobacteriales bacterium]
MDSHNSSGYRVGDCGACPHADTHAETRKTQGLSPHATTPPDDTLPGRGPVPTQANAGGLGACPLTGHASSSDAVLIEPIAYIRTPFGSKFGVPRQSGIAEAVEAVIEFTPRYCNSDALRGIEGFSHLWLIWGFHQARRDDGSWTPLVRPPRLGGNEKVGVFACRSPFRPNNLGLSAV